MRSRIHVHKRDCARTHAHSQGSHAPAQAHACAHTKASNKTKTEKTNTQSQSRVVNVLAEFRACPSRHCVCLLVYGQGSKHSRMGKTFSTFLSIGITQHSTALTDSRGTRLQFSTDKKPEQITQANILHLQSRFTQGEMFVHLSASYLLLWCTVQVHMDHSTNLTTHLTTFPHIRAARKNIPGY